MRRAGVEQTVIERVASEIGRHMLSMASGVPLWVVPVLVVLLATGVVSDVRRAWRWVRLWHHG